MVKSPIGKRGRGWGASQTALLSCHMLSLEALLFFLHISLCPTLTYLPSLEAFLLFFFWCGKFRVKKLIITQKPHTLLSLFWFDSRVVGFSLSWSFPTWKRGKRDHLSTLWQEILQREQLTHGPLSRHSPRLTQAPA